MDSFNAQLAVLAASSSSLSSTGCQAWDRKVADWLTLDALARSDEEFGVYAKATLEHDNLQLALEEKYGRSYRKDAEGKKLAEDGFKRICAAEEARLKAFLEPMWASTVELALTSAPNLAAALFKIEVIKREELDNWSSMPRDSFELVAEDMACLSEGRVS